MPQQSRWTIINKQQMAPVGGCAPRGRRQHYRSRLVVVAIATKPSLPPNARTCPDHVPLIVILAHHYTRVILHAVRRKVQSHNGVGSKPVSALEHHSRGNNRFRLSARWSALIRARLDLSRTLPCVDLGLQYRLNHCTPPMVARWSRSAGRATPQVAAHLALPQRG